jgi:DNA-binding transcriptional LysR family regulator
MRSERLTSHYRLHDDALATPSGVRARTCLSSSATAAAAAGIGIALLPYLGADTDPGALETWSTT